MYVNTLSSGFVETCPVTASKNVYVATSRAAELLSPEPTGTVDVTTALNPGVGSNVGQNIRKALLEDSKLTLDILYHYFNIF